MKLADSVQKSELGLATFALFLSDQRLSEFKVDKNQQIITFDSETSSLMINIRNMSLSFDLKFNLISVPELLKDQGIGFIKVDNFDVSLHLFPFS